MKLSQTLAGSWVITVANPEEDGWETQLAEFDMSAVGAGSPAEKALIAAAAAAFVTLTASLSPRSYHIESHDPAARLRMMEAAANAADALSRDIAA